MRISINLATHPFVEMRPLFAKLRLAMAALALTAIALGIGLHFLSARSRAAQVEMDVLKRQTEALQAERRTNEARMMQPQNRAVLDRSKFLNTLFEKKSFSWTSVMMDLERVLPAGVQVTSIEPVITAEGDVNIRMRVSGQRELAVDLVRNLERSQRFLSPRLSNETMQTQDQNRLVPAAQSNVPGGVEFEILSGYNPLPTKSAAPDGSAGNADEQEPVALAPKAAASSAPNATNKANAGGSPKKTASSGAAKKAANGGTR